MFTRPGSATYNPPGTSTQTAAQWDAGITSFVDLAAVVTAGLTPPVIRAWINAEDGTEQVWRLLVSSLAPDGISIIRPNDYNPASPKTWFKAST